MERSDSAGSRRLRRLGTLIDERLLENPQLREGIIAELSDLLEQLDAEYDELLRGQSETELLHRRFADLYEYAPVGYLVLNADRIIIQVNETARQFLGAQAIDLGRSALGPNITSETQEQYYDALRRCRERGEPESAEFEIKRTDGQTFWVSGRITCETERAGEVAGYRVILSDITERVLAQRQAESLLEEKELLLREIHHRVKNDFGLVSAFLALQFEDTENEELKNGMREARSRIQTMAQTYDILHRQEQYARVELKSLLEQIVSGVRSGSAEVGIEVTTEIDELSAPSSVAVGLGLVANELLMNAKKYAVEKRRALKITVSLHRIQGGELQLQVADNGPGFAQGTIDGRDRGFGLTVVHALAEQHHGSVTLENRDGAVTTVRMQLPE